MNTELKKTLQERHMALIIERDQFIINVNQKLGEYAGRLSELDDLLKQAVTPNEDDRPNAYETTENHLPSYTPHNT